MAISTPGHLGCTLDPASAEVIAKRRVKVTTKIIDNVFFFIETPSFPSNLSGFTYIDGGNGEFIHGGRGNGGWVFRGGRGR
jgi:hypothetical protein